MCRFLISQAAVPVCQLFDEFKDVKRVTTTLGWEQEYFVIDERLYNLRPDLMLTGRTLLGKIPPKTQQLEDHYFARYPVGPPSVSRLAILNALVISAFRRRRSVSISCAVHVYSVPLSGYRAFDCKNCTMLSKRWRTLVIQPPPLLLTHTFRPQLVPFLAIVTPFTATWFGGCPGRSNHTALRTHPQHNLWLATSA